MPRKFKDRLFSWTAKRSNMGITIVGVSQLTRDVVKYTHTVKLVPNGRGVTAYCKDGGLLELLI